MKFWLLIMATLSCATLFTTGCSDPPPPTYPIAGEVTLDGKPLATGVLTLVPVKQGAGVPPIEIVDGRFASPVIQAPQAGDYRVEISAFEKTGRLISDPDLAGVKTEETRQIIPSRYNTQSTLSLNLPGDNYQSLSFALKRK